MVGQADRVALGVFYEILIKIVVKTHCVIMAFHDYFLNTEAYAAFMQVSIGL
jgi:hypothetical protein